MSYIPTPATIEEAPEASQPILETIRKLLASLAQSGNTIKAPLAQKHGPGGFLETFPLAPPYKLVYTIF